MNKFDDWEETKTPEEEAEDQETRRNVLAYVLSNYPRDPRRFGIHGFEVCQQCGEIGSYSGQWGAVGSHGTNGLRKKDHPLPPGAFIAGRHDHSETPARRGHRFCEICRAGVLAEEADPFFYLVLCPACSKAMRSHVPEDQMATVLLQFTKFRWRYHALIEDEPWNRGRYP